MIRKILFAFLFVLILQNSFAQKSQLFIKAGATFSKFTSENEMNFYDVNSLIGYQVGILCRFPLAKKIALQPSLQIISKGGKSKGGNPPYTVDNFDATTCPIYLELPVNLVFDIPLKSNGYFFVGAGAYGAIGVGGTNDVKASTGAGPYDDKQKIEFGDSEQPIYPIHNYAGIGYMNKTDIGITVTAGFRIKKWIISIDYEHGLKNIDQGTRVRKDENKNRVLGLSFGWQLL